MMTTVNDVNDKTKIWDEFVLTVCFTAELISKLIDNRCTCKFITKTTAAF